MHTVQYPASDPARSPGWGNFPPLESVTRPTVDTAAAAYYSNRRPQTLRIWACKESGPIRPLRVHGRLAWPVADLRRLLGADGSGPGKGCEGNGGCQ
jgi:hypothetical protein